MTGTPRATVESLQEQASASRRSRLNQLAVWKEVREAMGKKELWIIHVEVRNQDEAALLEGPKVARFGVCVDESEQPDKPSTDKISKR